MGRPKKPLSETKKHYTIAEQEDKKLAESLVIVGNEDLKKPPDWLIDSIAKKEYNRIVKEQIKIEIIGNLDLNNITAYCNAYAMYRKATIQLSKEPLINERGNENPLFKIQKNYADEMRKFGSKCGLDIDSRLKAGTQKTNQIKEEIIEEFGDI